MLILVLFMLLSVVFAGCASNLSANLNSELFEQKGIASGDQDLIEFIHEDIYFSFKYPALFDGLEVVSQTEEFPYRVEYKNGLLNDFIIDIYDGESWELNEDTIPETITVQTANYFFYLDHKWETDENYKIIENSFHAEELSIS